ncbi:MAG: hypothetical protein NWP98_05465, partial [Erythrobacter sp.]|nr:hypothetical protein [Erythrobacter sp.]
TLTGPDGSRRLLALRDSRSSYTRDNLMELAGVGAEPVPLAQWPGARCSSAFCTVTISRGGRDWTVLLGRARTQVAERALAAACAKSDIVISERFLPRSCRPLWLKADRRMLERSGGISINLADQRITTVADQQGTHGWWKGALSETDRAWPNRDQTRSQAGPRAEQDGSGGHLDRPGGYQDGPRPPLNPAAGAP